MVEECEPVFAQYKILIWSLEAGDTSSDGRAVSRDGQEFHAVDGVFHCDAWP